MVLRCIRSYHANDVNSGIAYPSAFLIDPVDDQE